MKTGKYVTLQFNALSVTSGNWLFGISVDITCLLPAFLTRFQCKFDKYKNAGGSDTTHIQ